MFRKSEGIRLLCYLLKDSTTSDMAEPFQEKYLESGLEYTKYRMQYIASLIIHAKEHFDDIDLSVHLQLIELILRQKGPREEKSLIWDPNLLYSYLHKLISRHYIAAEDMDPEQRSKLEDLTEQLMDKVKN